MQFLICYSHELLQRVLEHCDDPKTQQIMMDEILQSVCLLAQDQYGNYVVQVSAVFSFERDTCCTCLPGFVSVCSHAVASQGYYVDHSMLLA